MSDARFDIAFPYGVDPGGRTAGSASYDDHVREMIEQVLFTAPGERVNRPEFGSGLMQLVFRSISAELLGATRLALQGNLQRWLGDVIAVEDLQVAGQESTVTITIQYVVLATRERRRESFTR